MAHEEEPITELDDRADLAAVIAKINEIIEQINHMFNPEDGT